MHAGTTERGEQIASLVAPWYAAYTKHNHEKRAAELLERKGVEVFLPLYREAHRWKDRMQMVALPLFPSYLFVRTNPEQKLDVLKTPGIFFLVENGGRACPITHAEIEAVQRLVRNSDSVRPHPYLKTGDRVRICCGSLAGIEGILTRVKNQHRVVLSVDLVSQSLAVEVDLAILERLPASRLSAPPQLQDESRRAPSVSSTRRIDIKRPQKDLNPWNP
jgi:transcription elongation factor/antiterminator RfaH